MLGGAVGGEALLARARGQVEVSSSDEEESESEEEEEEKEEEIPTGEATCILGAFNMDWDEVSHIRVHRNGVVCSLQGVLQIEAEDLLVLLSSFLPAGGVITEVEIRATKEGASAMELEDTKGPQIDEGELSSEDEDDDPFADAQAHKSLDARVNSNELIILFSTMVIRWHMKRRKRSEAGERTKYCVDMPKNVWDTTLA